MSTTRDNDIKFLLKHYLRIGELSRYSKYEDFQWDDIEQILDSVITFSKEELQPLNKIGDTKGTPFKNGNVTITEEFKNVWQLFAESGWLSLNMNPEFGGSGLPYSLQVAATEYYGAANPAFHLCAGLSIGAARLIEEFGSDELKNTYVENMYTGQWTGTMCLTEPQAGSDLSLVQTKAVPDGDAYKITGSKIFITWGNHDVTENIIHLVLARIEGAPEGTAGISLFVVPKYCINDDGSVGEFNNVNNIGIEEKMGFHGSPTCSLEFEQSRGYLIGEAHRGLPHMFQLMNEARLMIGTLSLGISSEGYAHSLAYAKERIQGAPFGVKGKAVPIIEHTDVRRMLIHQKSLTEGIRSLLYKTAYYVDCAEQEEGELHDSYEDLVHLFVPLCKSYASDQSWLLLKEAIQVVGGAGYTREYPLEQLARDTKINSIWEGTNYIQAMDLVGRKLRLHDGRLVKNFIALCKKVTEGENCAGFDSFVEIFNKAVTQLTAVIEFFSKKDKVKNVPWGATRFLDSFAEVAIAMTLLEQLPSIKKLSQESNLLDDQKQYLVGKKASIRYFFENILPQTTATLENLLTSTVVVDSLSEKAF